MIVAKPKPFEVKATPLKRLITAPVKKPKVKSSFDFEAFLEALDDELAESNDPYNEPDYDFFFD